MTIDTNAKDVILAAVAAYPGVDMLPVDPDSFDEIKNMAESDDGGDTLLVFIVREISDVTKLEPSPFEAAANAMDSAAQQLLAVAAALREKSEATA